MFYIVVQIDKLHDINGIVPPLCNIRPLGGGIQINLFVKTRTT